MDTSLYTHRIASLKSWPKRNVFNIVELARSGLYYLGPCDDVYDRLRCAFCEFIVADLKSGDNLWKIHASFVPLCWRVLSYKGKEFVQSVLREDEPCQEQRALLKFPDGKMLASRLHSSDLTITGIGKHLIQKEQSKSIGPSLHITERGVLFTKPKHHDMTDPEKRLASFDNIDGSFRRVLSLNIVVAAGFFYIGPGDVMRCYYCGIGLKDWNKQDDPWVEHVRQAPSCMHVILTKGEEFVEKVFADRSGEMRNPPFQNASNIKRQFEFEVGDEAADGKRFRVVGVKDREGTDRSRSENTNVFPSADINVSNMTCDTCRAVGDIFRGTGSVCDRTWTCESCIELSRN